MNTVSLTVFDCPPSLNAVSRGSWRRFHYAKKAWQHLIEQLLMSENVPRGNTHVSATATVRFPQRRRRDEGNYRSLLEKSLGDALVNGGWLDDDTPQHFTFRELTFEPDAGPRRTVITITVTP